MDQILNVGIHFEAYFLLFQLSGKMKWSYSLSWHKAEKNIVGSGGSYWTLEAVIGQFCFLHLNKFQAGNCAQTSLITVLTSSWVILVLATCLWGLCCRNLDYCLKINRKWWYELHNDDLWQFTVATAKKVDVMSYKYMYFMLVEFV